MYCKLAKDTCLVNICYYQLCWGRWMTGCDRQGPKRINLLKQKLDVFGAMKRHLGGNSLGRLTSWTLHGGSQWSQPWIFTAFATHECHNHSTRIARLHAWLVDSWVRNLWRRQLEFIGPLFFFHMTITSRCRFGFIQLKLVKAVGSELGKIFNFSKNPRVWTRLTALRLCPFAQRLFEDATVAPDMLWSGEKQPWLEILGKQPFLAGAT